MCPKESQWYHTSHNSYNGISDQDDNVLLPGTGNYSDGILISAISDRSPW